MNAILDSMIPTPSTRAWLSKMFLTLLLLFTFGLRPANGQTGYLEPALGANETNLIILIHGWNPDEDPNMYLGEWFANLQEELETATNASEWSVHRYRWEDDAMTGSLFEIAGSERLFSIVGYRNATEAAEIGASNGLRLHSILNAQPKLRKVHFIAHSAGSWVAREAAARILASNPYVIVQITLMDPFIPGVPGGIDTPLNPARMSGLASLAEQNRIYRLENYYCDDATDAVNGGPLNVTSQVFAWRTRDIQLDVAYTTILIFDLRVYGGAFNGHREPIHFMADSVTSTIGQVVPIRQAYAPWPGSYSSYGFHRSMFNERFAFPRFTTQPSYSGGTITATVNNTTGLSFQWFKNGSSVPISGASATTLAVSPPASGTDRYVIRAWKASDPCLQAYSQEVLVPSVALPQPRIDSVSPQYLTGKPVPQTTRITITGANFTSTSRLEFNDGVNAPYTNRVPATWSPTQLTYDVAVGIEAANWTVKVVDGGVSSTAYAFYVIPPTGGKALTGLVIEGPATVNSGGTAQFKAKAHYSDATSAYVAASWSEDSGYASISSGGLLSASTVSSNREVTVSASYTEGGVLRAASTVAVIVTSSGSGGSQTTNVLANGTFEAGRSPWEPVGNADVVALSYPYSGSYYAYIGNTNNASGAISQFFPISTAMTDAVLEFYLNVSSDETTTTVAYDTMTISLGTQYDQHVADIATFSNLDKRSPGSYVKKSYNIKNIINAYKGQSLFLVFGGDTDSGLQTTFRMDNISVNITTSTPVSLVDLRIDGDSAVPENGFFAYNALAVFSDGTTQLVSPSVWSENSSASTIDGSGFFTTSSVSSITTVTVSASYTYNGVTRSASKQVTVFPRSNPPVLDRLTIEGPGWVDEGSYINLVGKAIFSNGSVQTVTPSWSLGSTWGSIDANGKLSANQVNGDRTVTVSASYSSGGITRSSSHDVMIIDGDATPSLDRIEIIGSGTVQERSNEAYEALAYFTDGSSRYVNPSWSEDSPAASITSYGLLSTSSVSGNATVTLSASYASDGIQKGASKLVTIIDIPDLAGPALAITSHSSGQASASQVIALSGVATDGGYGDSGISSVKVNGVPASGGSASGAGFANWSREITLVSGQNMIQVVATDGLGNSTTTSIEMSWTPVAGPPAFSWANSGGGEGDHRLNGLGVAQNGDVYSVIQHEGDFQMNDRVVGAQGTVESVLTKCDKEGRLLWILPFSSPLVVVTTSLDLTPSGQVMVAGYFGGTCEMGGVVLNSVGTRDCFVACVSPSGQVLWARSFGSSVQGSTDRCFLMGNKLLADGTSVLAGYFMGSIRFGASTVLSLGERDAFVAKLDRDGSPLWISHGQGTGNIRAMKIAIFNGCEVLVGGDYVGGLSWGSQSVTGTATAEGFVARIGASGEVMWIRSIQSPDDVAVTSLGAAGASGIYASGNFTTSLTAQGSSLTSRGYDDSYLIKFDSAGNAQWLRQIGSPDTDLCYDLVCRKDGGVWLTGLISGAGEFGGIQFGAEGSAQPYIAGFSPDGAEVGILAALSTDPGMDAGVGTQIATDWAGNLYSGGVFTGNLQFGTTNLSELGSANALWDVFIAKAGAASLEMPRLSASQASGKLHLAWPTGWDGWVLESTTTPELSTSWTLIPEQAISQGGMMYLVVPIDSPRRFFRLRIP